jgi:hypothetical protein
MDSSIGEIYQIIALSDLPRFKSSAAGLCRFLRFLGRGVKMCSATLRGA